MVKGTIQQQDVTVINIYAPNQGAPKYTKQLLTELKGEIDQNTIILGDLNKSLTAMDRSSKQKIKNEIAAQNNTLDEMDIIDIYRALRPKTSAYTFFSSVHGHSQGLNI
uniref:Endonuclease/exonuclease/phosphatase domain-containing protein n=1 Tax=Rhinolophus ferrumequinum TaxID=59479 RepID=A0A671EI33_RHIFE